MLQSLEASDFIIKYIPFGGSLRDTHYKLTDLFSLFYIHFMEAKPTGNPTFWEDNLHSPSLNAWRGFAFEEVCYIHQEQIKNALGISGIHSEMSPWRSKTRDNHTQIDMLINRDDRVINICEMKFYADEFVIDKAYDAVLRNKVLTFMDQMKVRKNPHLTLITTYGLKANQYSGRVQKIITMGELIR